MVAAAEIVDEVLQLLWPARCAACDAYVGAQAVFCGACDVSVLPLGDAACPGCALPGPGGGDRCAGCWRKPFPFSRAVASVLYGEASARAIVRMKHGDRRDLVLPLGRLLAPALRAALDPSADALLPVPLHPRKLRKREFNQALELTRVAARILARTGVPVPRIDFDLLRRTRNTSELGHAGPGARRREVAGAFAVRDARVVKGRRFIVTDDVMTTGATLSECARTLMEAGAADVRVVALARAEG